MELSELLVALRSTEGLSAKGKTQSTFYIGSKPFMHFHDGPAGLEADVKWVDTFERVPVGTAAQQKDLLRDVRAHLASR